MPIAVFLFFDPLFGPLFCFFAFSYVSKACISIQMGLDIFWGLIIFFCQQRNLEKNTAFLSSLEEKENLKESLFKGTQGAR